MREETWQEPLEAELMLLLPEETRDHGGRGSQQARRSVGMVVCSVSLYCVFSFDRVVFGSQECEVSCVLEGNVAWLQNFVLNLLLMTRIKGLCKEDRLLNLSLLLSIGSVSVHVIWLLLPFQYYHL